MRQITKEQQEELLDQKQERRQIRFFTKKSMVSMPFKVWSLSILQHVIFWLIKTMLNQIQDLRLYMFSCVASCHRLLLYFLEFIPFQLSYYIILKLLIIRFIVNYLLFFKFVQAFYAYKTICTKDNLFILDNGVFYGFLKILSWYEISTGYI